MGWWKLSTLQNVRAQGCLGGFLAKVFGGSRRASPGAALPKVMVNKKFVSAAEGDFFRVLRAVVGMRGHVLAQVSLRQMLWFPPNQLGLQTWRNKVAQRSVDFVVCDVATLRPLVAIELDEPSHARPERQCSRSGCAGRHQCPAQPDLLVSRTYDTRELEAALRAYLSPAGSGGVAVAGRKI